ncbi:MAG: ACT domain-containing protein [Eubacteriales bacterium]|nr:ACT domain-containing protein [Eubacteriales bacterium]
MDKIKYYLANANILPEVFSKVIDAKNILASGEAASVSQAVKMAGISRSAYYKYKDAIFEYNTQESDETATINAKLKDNAGVLSALMSEIYKAGANVLSVNQSVPVNSVADVSITVRIAEMNISSDELVNLIKVIDGVTAVSLS